MKLSKETLDILKNFAKINPQAVLIPGNRQIGFGSGRDTDKKASKVPRKTWGGFNFLKDEIRVR